MTRARRRAGNRPCAARACSSRSEADTVFSLDTGRESPAALDGRTRALLRAAAAGKAGSTLKIGAGRRSGLRSHSAVSGGITTPPVLGSRATDAEMRHRRLERLASWQTATRSPPGVRDTAALWRYHYGQTSGPPTAGQGRVPGHPSCARAGGTDRSARCAPYPARRMPRSPRRVYMILPRSGHRTH